MIDTPRYYQGRQGVLFPTFVKSNTATNSSYMEPCEKGNEKFICHRGVIEKIDGDRVMVSGQNCSMKEIQNLNDPHVFKKVNENYLFEDGLTCNYQNKETKLKLM